MPTSHQLATSFIQYLKEQALYDQLPHIVEDLKSELNRNQDITIITAEELSKEEKQKLESSLSQRWGEHTIVYTQDPILLSGLIIRFKDQLIDLSGRSALNDLAHELKQ